MAALTSISLLLCAYSLLPIIVSAAPIVRSSAKATLLFPRIDNTPDCTSESATDYYGIGVRLGVYFSWFSSYVANNFIPSEISGSLDTNAVFLLALISSIFAGSINHTLTQIDALVLMHLSAGYLFGVLSIWGYCTIHYQREGPASIRHFGRYGTHCRLGLTMAITAYGTWFWMEGVDDGLNTVDKPGCQVLYTFMFAKVTVLPAMRVIYNVMTIGCVFWYGAMVIAAAATEIRRLSTTAFGCKYTVPGLSHSPMKFETGFNRKELHYLYLILRSFNLSYMIFSILMVEFTLKFNHVKSGLGLSVVSPSQFLPMLIGLLSFVRVLWIWLFLEAEDEGGEEGEEEKAGEGGSFAESAVGQPKLGAASSTSASPSAPLRTARPGLGLQSVLFLLKSAFSPSTAVVRAPSHRFLDEPPVQRSIYVRYLVAFFPWLSQFDFWTTAAEPTPRPLRLDVLDGNQHAGCC